jgi:glycosyltransferase involved in cell wall biosynthesis
VTTGVLTTSFPRWPHDFAGCFVEDDVRARAARGDSLEVIAAGPPGASAGAVAGSTARATSARPDLLPLIRVMRLHLPGSAEGEGPPPLFFGQGAPETLEASGSAGWVQAALFWAALCREVRERAPRWSDVVAHWLVPSALAARIAAPWLPLTAYAHSGDVALLERLPGGPSVARLLAREARELVFASADLQRRFSRLCGFAVGSVGGQSWQNPRAPTRSLHRAGEGEAQSRQRTLLSVGRLVPIKGFDILLRALARLGGRFEHAAGAVGRNTFRLVILGDGPERVRLQETARRLDLDLVMPGTVGRDEVARWMSAADLYVQPSRRLKTGRTEGLPVATLEALSVGVPVIVSRTGGLAELADSHGAIVFEPEDVTGLAFQLARFS